MSEEILTPVETEEALTPVAEEKTAAPGKNNASLFFVPNLINLISALLILVVLVMALLTPLMKVGAPEDAQLPDYTGENEITVSALDILLDIGKEIGLIEDNVSAYVTPEKGGDFSKAITLLAYQATADYEEAMREYEAAIADGRTEERPERPAVENRSVFLFSCFSFLFLPLSVLAVAIAFVVVLIKAILRFFRCKPYPKLGDGMTALIVPAIVAAFVYGMPLVAELMGEDVSYLKYIGVTDAMTTVTVVGVVALVLDIIGKSIATGISKKHYPDHK